MNQKHLQTIYQAHVNINSMLKIGIQIKFGIAINVSVSAKIPEEIMLQNKLFLKS